MKDFHFQQFTIRQKEAAMKVGTDGVLLGAWAKPKSAQHILDIGCGTGLIALMLAQRALPSCKIAAIDIDEKTVAEANFNFQNSAWSNQLVAYQSSLQSFQSEQLFDLIVSNPPFFDATSAKHTQRTQARSQQTLSYADLLHYSSALLNQEGTFEVIIPNSDFNEFVKLAEMNNLHLFKHLTIHGNSTSGPIRSILSFQKTCATKVIELDLYIERERHDYTKSYRDLLEDYLTIFQS